MVKYYILVKEKTSKNWLGAIPIKKGATKTTVQKTLRAGRKKGYSYRIISESQLKKMLRGKRK